MKLKRSLLVGLLVLTAFSGLVASANGASTYLDMESGGATFPPKLLDGARIDLGDGPLSLPADQPYHIWQGWAQPGWTDLSSDGKVYFKALTMTLTIDGEPVKLHTWKGHFKEVYIGGTLYLDAMVKIYYVEFPEYYFSPGNYNFVLRATNIETIDVVIDFY
jgi:hypothetical protein